MGSWNLLTPFSNSFFLDPFVIWFRIWYTVTMRYSSLKTANLITFGEFCRSQSCPMYWGTPWFHGNLAGPQLQRHFECCDLLLRPQGPDDELKGWDWDCKKTWFSHTQNWGIHQQTCTRIRHNLIVVLWWYTSSWLEVLFQQLSCSPSMFFRTSQGDDRTAFSRPQRVWSHLRPVVKVVNRKAVRSSKFDSFSLMNCEHI